MKTKHCAGCDLTLPIDDYYFFMTKGYWQSKCKKCVYARIMKWRRSHPERLSTYRKTQRKKYTPETKRKIRANKYKREAERRRKDPVYAAKMHAKWSAARIRRTARARAAREALRGTAAVLPLTDPTSDASGS